MIMKTKLWIAIPVTLVFVLLLFGVFLLGRMTGAHGGHSSATEAGASTEAKAEFWTCSMHPQVQQPGPGKCPICAMDLVPVFENSNQVLGPREVELSEGAIALANVQTAPVIRHLAAAEVRMVGKVDYDETRLSYITARVPGRLDRLYVDYTGIPVNKGDHLVWLYSPELLAAQEELFQAIQTAIDLRQSSDRFLRERAEQTIQSTRDKLLLWGLSETQVREIEERKSASDHITINAPVGGIVIHKNALEGMYVKEGTQIYTIADLSQLWVRLDAYESDLAWLHFGQQVEFRTEAYPGERFTGWISFIDPVLDSKTRTAKVRVNVDNSDGRLKPEMFVRAVVQSPVAAGGKVMSPDLSGKWIGPMHPEVVSDEPGPCPVCGMPLVSAESLGYQAVSAEEASVPLVIPATAPLITGKRAVVYVTTPERPGVFEGRVVELGPRAGDFYIVESGLTDGELVVTHGAFKIDSAVQILAKPSMMNPEQGQGVEGDMQASEPRPVYHPPVEFQNQLRRVVDSYFSVADALSHDSLEDAQAALSPLKSVLSEVDMSLVEGDAHMFWMEQLKIIQGGVNGIEAASEIKLARAEFEHVSNGLIAAVDSFGLTEGASVYVYHCPMASGGKGADWLQNKQGTENPFYGSMMFSCGEETRVIEARPAQGDGVGKTSEKLHQH
jgi:Cu(I)/Ag(I) efflux system membrane fusion protein